MREGERLPLGSGLVTDRKEHRGRIAGADNEVDALLIGQVVGVVGHLEGHGAAADIRGGGSPANDRLPIRAAGGQGRARWQTQGAEGQGILAGVAGLQGELQRLADDGHLVAEGAKFGTMGALTVSTNDWESERTAKGPLPSPLSVAVSVMV